MTPPDPFTDILTLNPDLIDGRLEVAFLLAQPICGDCLKNFVLEAIFAALLDRAADDPFRHAVVSFACATDLPDADHSGGERVQ
jgi:hypothetical protein